MKKLYYITMICSGFILCCTTKCFATTYSFSEIGDRNPKIEISVPPKATTTDTSKSVPTKLILTPTTKDDIPKLAEYLMDTEVTRYLERIPLDFHDNKAEAQEYLGKLLENPNTISYTIRLENGTLIGTIAFTHDTNIVCIDYWIGKDYWRKGYVFTAAKTLANIVIKASDVHKLGIYFVSENKKSSDTAISIFKYLTEQNKNLQLELKEVGPFPAVEYEGRTFREGKGYILEPKIETPSSHPDTKAKEQ